MEDLLIKGKREEIKKALESDPDDDYDLWIRWATLEEQAQNVENARDVYEQAISRVPTQTSKEGWRRYVLVWLLYASFEEGLQEGERAEEVYRNLIEIVPH